MPVTSEQNINHRTRHAHAVCKWLASGCLALLATALLGCERRTVSIEAVVFYRVFSLPTAGGSCRLYVAIPVPTALERVPERERAFYLEVRPQGVPSAVLRESSLSSPNELSSVLPGGIVTVRDGRAYFEPEFSPLQLRGALCSELMMEEGRAKYLRLELHSSPNPRKTEVVSVHLARIVRGQVLFMK